MTWWMIALAVIGYCIVGGIISGLTYDEWDKSCIMIGSFWPISFVILLIWVLCYLPFKFGEWVWEKLTDIF